MEGVLIIRLLRGLEEIDKRRFCGAVVAQSVVRFGHAVNREDRNSFIANITDKRCPKILGTLHKLGLIRSDINGGGVLSTNQPWEVRRALNLIVAGLWQKEV